MNYYSEQLWLNNEVRGTTPPTEEQDLTFLKLRQKLLLDTFSRTSHTPVDMTTWLTTPPQSLIDHMTPKLLYLIHFITKRSYLISDLIKLKSAYVS